MRHYTPPFIDRATVIVPVNFLSALFDVKSEKTGIFLFTHKFMA